MINMRTGDDKLPFVTKRATVYSHLAPAPLLGIVLRPAGMPFFPM